MAALESYHGYNPLYGSQEVRPLSDSINVLCAVLVYQTALVLMYSTQMKNYMGKKHEEVSCKSPESYVNSLLVGVQNNKTEFFVPILSSDYKTSSSNSFGNWELPIVW